MSCKLKEHKVRTTVWGEKGEYIWDLSLEYNWELKEECKMKGNW